MIHNSSASNCCHGQREAQVPPFCLCSAIPGVCLPEEACLQTCPTYTSAHHAAPCILDSILDIGKLACSESMEDNVADHLISQRDKLCKCCCTASISFKPQPATSPLLLGHCPCKQHARRQHGDSASMHASAIFKSGQATDNDKGDPQHAVAGLSLQMTD